MLRNSLILCVGALAPVVLTGVWVFHGDCCSKNAQAAKSAERPACCSMEDGAMESADPAAPATEASPAEPTIQGAMGDATIKGTIKFEGAAPTRETIKMDTDPVCAKAHSEASLKEDVIVSKEGQLKNVFVYIKKGIEGKYDAPKEAAVLDQKGCIYMPHVFGIVAGQKLIVRNDDGTTHNVHTYNKRNTGVNQAQPAGSKELELEWKQAEAAVAIKCDIHAWMGSICHVMKHPFFAVTDEKGNFEIKNLPAGDYTVEAVHETLGAQTAQVKIAAKESKDSNFTFKK